MVRARLGGRTLVGGLLESGALRLGHPGRCSIPMSRDPLHLVERMLAGDRLALARLITLVENRGAAVPAVMKAVHAQGPGAYVTGITGPPGAGKSTVVDRLVALLRAEGAPVGVIAVDPSSPFTGGAGLGGRLRMQTHALYPGLFIRRCAPRRSLRGVWWGTAGG